MAATDTQSSENSNQENETENLDAALSKREQFLATFCSQQNWALPDSMIYRLTMNPSNPKGYQKLMQSCKYFFIKNPILINENLSVSLLGNDGITMYFEEKKDVQLPNNISSKIWITEAICFRSDENSNSDLVSSVIPKIYQVDAIKISLFNQNIFYQDFKILSSKVEMLLFYKVTVKDENGIIVAPEILVEALPKLKVLSLSSNNSHRASSSSTITSKSFNELLKIPHFLTLESCSFICILADFDIETFYIYMKKNKRTKFFLFFDSISEAYENRLKEIIDEILATTNHDYKIPFISFTDADIEKRKKLENLYNGKN